MSVACVVPGVTGGGRAAMADSNITKQALATSLRELMEEVPFDKINVAQICERCGMNRKSFYYHFKDKYDLVNWHSKSRVKILFQIIIQSILSLSCEAIFRICLGMNRWMNLPSTSLMTQCFVP